MHQIYSVVQVRQDKQGVGDIEQCLFLNLKVLNKLKLNNFISLQSWAFIATHTIIVLESLLSIVGRI